MIKKELNFKEYLILIIVLLLGIYGINNTEKVAIAISSIGGVLSPFVLGACLAFLINIPMSFFQKLLRKVKNKKLVTSISLVLAIIVIVFVLGLVITLIVPKLVNIVSLLIEKVPYYVQKINEMLNEMEIDFSLSQIDTSSIDTETIKNQILDAIPSILTSSGSIISNFVTGISNFVISIMFSMYILMDKEKLGKQILNFLNANFKENTAKAIVNIATVASGVFRKFFTLQCLEATILGGLCVIGMLILNIPYAVSIGVLVGVTSLIPNIGSFIGMIIGAILIVSVSPIKVLYFVVFLLVLQQIESNFIYPRIVGNSVGLPGMWVLFAVTVGGAVAGIVGMLLGVPTATTIYNLLEQNTNMKLKSRSKTKMKEVEV